MSRKATPLDNAMVESFFHTLSSNRSFVSGMLKEHRCDGDECNPALT